MNVRIMKQIIVIKYIVSISYYKTMWLQRSYVMVPLLKLSGNAPRQEQLFNKMKALLMHDCLNAYPDLNLPLNIYMDESDYQLGAAIIQDG